MTSNVAFLSRHERFRSVPSTNDIVRSWLTEGTPEVCLAVAAEQTAGRGRSGRTWTAPDGSALLLSLGFRPAYVAPDRLWRLAAVVSLAMCDAAEDAAGLPVGMLKLKWPNDIVVEMPEDEASSGTEAGTAPGGAVTENGIRKLAGVLGESIGAGTADPIAIVGIGINTDWPRDRFPAELAGIMTSLRETSRGRAVDNEELLTTFLLHLEPRVIALQEGSFDVAGWHQRQVTTGRIVRIEMPDAGVITARAVGVDGSTGALLIEDATGSGDTGDTGAASERELLVGEVVHVRLSGDSAAGV